MRRVALILALAGVACTSVPTAPPGALVVGIANSPTNLDPAIGLDEVSQKLHQVLYSSLVGIDESLRVVPDLATRFETADSRTWVAAIPPGVRFHDGREMTATDVAYTFQRFLDPALVSGRKGAYRDLESIEILDPYTVAFHLRAPSASFPINLVMGIVPAGSGAELSRRPIGSGPYRVVEFLPDDRVTVAAFEGYYRGAPANTGLVFKVVPDDTMRGLELRKGSLDLVVNDLGPDLVHGLERLDGLQVVRSPGTDFAYLGFNMRHPVLADRRVRQAIGHGIDTGAIISHLRRGLANPSTGIVPAISWAAAPDVTPHAFDPGRARALLDEAGLVDPDGAGPQPRLTLTLKTSTAEAYRLQATVIQHQLADIGIAIEVRSYEFATLFADVVRGNVELYTLQFVGVTDPDMLRRVLHSTQIPPAGLNRGHYRSAEVDRLLDAAAEALDSDTRRQYYQDVQRLVAIDVPFVSLWTRTNVVVAQADLTGLALSPTADFGFLRHVTRATRTPGPAR
ncbi:MAG TPA: ABC transporter substrate-binding protein [Vicinamibacterales bacterium]|nr:ABC transporter substrate-binding protein [Vicinamibacterales bacterium]